MHLIKPRDAGESPPRRDPALPDRALRVLRPTPGRGGSTARPLPPEPTTSVRGKDAVAISRDITPGAACGEPVSCSATPLYAALEPTLCFAANSGRIRAHP